MHSLLAGEALRGSNNDFNVALDALLNPGKRAGLTLAVSLREATAAQEKEERKVRVISEYMGTISTRGNE